MTEIKTAAAWCFKYDDALHPMEITPEWISPKQVPVSIIEGYSVPDILAGLELLAKSREVCEWKRTSGIEMFCDVNYETQCGLKLELYDLPTSEDQKDRPYGGTE